MCPRLIAGAPGIENPGLSLYQRFEDFVRQIILIPKAEADKETDKGRAAKRGSKIKSRKVVL